jgi:hypothetical protein
MVRHDHWGFDKFHVQWLLGQNALPTERNHRINGCQQFIGIHHPFAKLHDFN